MDKRIRHHFGTLRSGNHTEVLQYDFDIYGEEHFHHYILEEIKDTEELHIKEWEWIEYYKTYIPKYGIEFGYNLQKPKPHNKVALKVNKKKNGKYSPKKLSKKERINVKKILERKKPEETWTEIYKRIAKMYDISEITVKRIRKEMD